MRLAFVLNVVCVSATCFLLSTVAAGEGKHRKKGDKNSDHSSGTMEYIIDHAVELKITAEQMAKIEALQDAEERIMSDPAVAAIVQKVHEAKQKGDKQALDAQRERLGAKIKERTGGKFGLPKEELRKILSPEQSAALTDMRKKNQPADASKDDPKAPQKPVNPFDI